MIYLGREDWQVSREHTHISAATHSVARSTDSAGVRCMLLLALRFLPRHGAARYSVLQWLEWQMGGIGPMLGQLNHFYVYAPEKLPYAQKRYLTEAKRLVAVLDKQLGQHTHVAGPDYSIG